MASDSLTVNATLFEIFQKLDRNKDGIISIHELKYYLRSTNFRGLEEKLHDLDVDNNGQIDFKGNVYCF